MLCYVFYLLPLLAFFVKYTLWIPEMITIRIESWNKKSVIFFSLKETIVHWFLWLSSLLHYTLCIPEMIYIIPKSWKRSFRWKESMVLLIFWLSFLLYYTLCLPEIIYIRPKSWKNSRIFFLLERKNGFTGCPDYLPW